MILVVLLLAPAVGALPGVPGAAIPCAPGALEQGCVRWAQRDPNAGSYPIAMTTGVLVTEGLALTQVFQTTPQGDLEMHVVTREMASGLPTWIAIVPGAAPVAGVDPILSQDGAVAYVAAIDVTTQPPRLLVQARRLATGALAWEHRGPEEGFPAGLDLSADGTRLAVLTSHDQGFLAGSATLALLDAAAGATLWNRPIPQTDGEFLQAGDTRFAGDHILATSRVVTFACSGSCHLTGGAARVLRYDADGALAWRADLGDGFDTIPDHLAVADGRAYLTGLRFDAPDRAFALDVATGATLWAQNVAGSPRGAGLALEGARYVVATDGAGARVLESLDAATGALVATAQVPGASASVLAVSPDGARVAVLGAARGTAPVVSDRLGHDDAAIDLTVHDAATGATLSRSSFHQVLSGGAASAAWSPDAATVVAVGYDRSLLPTPHGLVGLTIRGDGITLAFAAGPPGESV